MRVLLAALAALVLLGLPAVPAPAPAAPVVDCSQACNVRVTGAAGPANDVAVAVDPSDPNTLVAVAKDYGLAAPACGTGTAWVGVHTSHDGGATWRSQLLPGFPGSAEPSVLAAFDCLLSPAVAMGPKGRAMVTGVGIAMGSGGDVATSAVWVAQSFDHGDHWSSLALVTAGPGLAQERPAVALDPITGGAFVAWTELTPAGPIAFMARSVEGFVWQPPLIPEDSSVSLVPDLHVGSTGLAFALGNPHGFADVADVYASWIQGNDVWEVLSIDGGGSWEHYVHVDTITPVAPPNTPYPTPTLPAAAATRIPGISAFWSAWADQRTGSPDILMRRAPDNGHTFLEAVRITDDPPGPAAQFFPALASGPDQCVHAAWYDRRDDPANARNGVYFGMTCDGGNWTANLKVADPSDPTLSLDEQGNPWLGEHIGLAVGSDNVAHLVWTDTRDGRADIYAARILP